MSCSAKNLSPHCAIGAFVNGPDNLKPFQKLIGKKLAVVLSYVHWFDPFPQADADLVSANGSIPLLTWEPWITNEFGALEAIAAGSYERYVREFLLAAKTLGQPILLRFGHEMNGNWYPWDGEHNGQVGAGERYKKAWRYLYNVKQELGATNVSLVWTPNNRNIPEADWNEIAHYYPGDEYVDWVGMDGYNWGYSAWESFDQIFGRIYDKLVLLTNKPIMIGEFSSAEQGGDKGGWIKEALASFKTKYPRIKLFCWFNINKERDWRIESSPASQAAFREVISNSYFTPEVL